MKSGQEPGKELAELKDKEIEYCDRHDCIYRGYLAYRSNGHSFCNYACIEHKPRGCSISECDKYKPTRKKKPVMRDGYIQWVEVDEND